MTVFKSDLILVLLVFSRSRLDIQTRMNLSLTFKTSFNSDAIHNCRPTAKWYSMVFLIWGWENIKHVLQAHSGIQPIHVTFYKNPLSPCIANPEKLHMQQQFRENCQPLVVLKPVHT